LQQYGKNRHITPNISEYPGPILPYLTGLVVVLVRMIRLEVAQRMLLWHPVKFRFMQNDLYSLLWRSTRDWLIVQLLSKVSVAIIRLHRIEFW